MRNTIPDYINEKSNIIRLIVFTALFALLFINIYKPFSSSSWYPVSEFKFFFFSNLIILTGVLVVVVSRFIMYLHTRRKPLFYGEFFIWVAAEIFFMSAFYTLYTSILNPERNIWHVFKGSVINTALVLLLPYSVLWLYFSWRDKKHQLETIQNNNTDSPKQDAFSFRDERGELKLSLKKENLMYIASADNYVKIWYLSKGKLSGFMLRNSLKTIENSINDASIVRCHRSYIVNFDRVKVLKKDKEGICLEFDEEQVPDLPISKTYAERITTLFLKQGNFSA